MADEKELEIDNSGKKKKLVIIIAIVAVLAIGGAGAFFFMGGSSDPAEQAQLAGALDSGAATEASVESKAANVGTALYVPVPRFFRFNVPGSARDRFVEIRVQLLVRGVDNEEIAKKHIPLLESTLLGVFQLSNADDLATSAGKAQLKEKALAAAQKIMVEVENKKVVEQVLFTGFVMQ